MQSLKAPNRLELDLESLSSSLRQGWGTGNYAKVTASLNELKRLFPDLLPAEVPGQDYRHLLSGPNCYDILKLKAVATDRQIVTSFFRQLREMLHKKSQPNHDQSYVKLLDAAFILRKPRLRLSHDLVAVSSWLEASNHSGGRRGQGQASVEEVTKTSQYDTASQISQTDVPGKPAIEIPLLLKLLLESDMISATESQALLAQMKRVPEVPLESLVLKSGYVMGEEMASLQLAVRLLTNGKVTQPQILVALYDQRNSSVRMAESLQIRGWLPVEVEGKGVASPKDSHKAA